MLLYIRVRDLRSPPSPHRICEIKMENEDLLKVVEADTTLKDMIINHIGETLSPDNGDVTVDMAVEVFAQEFPEFLMAVAEEILFEGTNKLLLTCSHMQRPEAMSHRRSPPTGTIQTLTTGQKIVQIENNGILYLPYSCMCYISGSGRCGYPRVLRTN